MRSRGERFARAAAFVSLTLAVLALVFALGWTANDLTASSSGGSATSPINGKLLDEIYAVLKQNFVDKAQLTPAKIQAAAINGIISSLNDPHTTYLTPADLKSGELDLNSTYQGIGATVAQQNGHIVIVAPFRGSPAQEAGIRSGDIILAVDGHSTATWTLAKATEQIRGPKGTKVTITVQHTDGTKATITMTRGDIPIQTVFTQPVDELIPGKSGTKLVDQNGQPLTDIAYVNISQFNDKTPQELNTLLNSWQGKGYKGLILDMRGNPGGLLDAVIQVANQFLDKGTILTEKDANGHVTRWTAKAGGLETKIPIVILMDHSSASGAEVLAGALRDNGRAQIVGTNSFGKGTVNELIPLNGCGVSAGCGAVYVSVGRWYTPNGTQIEGVGLKPNYSVPMTSAQYQSQGDIQFFKALSILQQEIASAASPS